MEGEEKLKLRRTSEDVDIISDLPDSILCHILSFLPTKDAMRSSFVSKRWESLWASVPLIDLDQSHFIRRQALDHNIVKEMKIYAEFVERFIAFHGGSHIPELRLRVDVERYLRCTSRVERWIHTVMTSDAMTIDIDFSGNSFDLLDMNESLGLYILPPCGFPSRSLRVLRLRFCQFRLKNPRFVSLQTIVLTAVIITDSSVSALVSDTLCLEKLHLEGCYVPNSFLLETPAASRLKCIVVDNCITPGHKFIGHFTLNIPSLQSFKFKGIINDFSVKNLKNLIDFEIDEQHEINGFPNHEYFMVCELFNGLVHTQTLTLSSWLYLEVLNGPRHSDDDLLMYDLYNLRHLNLKMWVAGIELWSLAALLSFSPNLETLSIDIVEPEATDASYMLVPSVLKEDTVWDKLKVPFDFLFTLEKVEIKGFEGRGNEIEFVKFLLKNSVYLESIVIYIADLTARYGKYKNEDNKETLEKLQAQQKKFKRKYRRSKKITLC